MGDDTFTADYEHLVKLEDNNGPYENPKTHTSRNAQVSMSWDGTFMVTWEEFRDNDQIDAPVDVVNSWGIYYRRFAPNGVPDSDTDSQANLTVTALVPPPMPFYSLQQSAPYAGSQVNPSIGMDADGDYVIVWDGNGATADPGDPTNLSLMTDRDPQGIWTRTFHAQDFQQVHEAVSQESRVNLTQQGYQRFPSVAMTPDGDYVVVWSGKGSGDVEGVYARRYDEATDTAGPMLTDFLLPDGTSISSSRQITQPVYAVVLSFDEALSDATATNIANYQLLRDGINVSGGITQAFYGLDMAYQLSGQYGLNAQRTNKYQVVLIVDANGVSPGVTPLTDGQYQIVALNSIRDKAGNPLLGFVQNLNGSAMSQIINVTVPTGQETLVSDGVNQSPPAGQYTYATTADSVASDADGDYVAAWTDTTAGQEGVWVRMYTQVTVLNSDGSRTTSAVGSNPIHVSLDTTASDASVARDVDGDFVVTWSAWNSTTNWDVYAQQFNAAGQAVGNTFRVNSTTTDVQRYSSVALDADGDFVVTWQSNLQDGSGFGIYAQTFSAEGEKLGGTDEIQDIYFMDGFTGTFRLSWDDDNNPLTPNKVTAPITSTGNATASVDAIQSALTAIGADVKVVGQRVTYVSVEFKGASGGKNVAPLSVTDVHKTGGDANAQILVDTSTEGKSGEFLVNDTKIGDQIYPDVAIDDSGSFVITWTSYGQDGDNAIQSNIYAKQYPSGSPVWVSPVSQSAQGLEAGGTPGSQSAAKVVSVDDPVNHEIAPRNRLRRRRPSERFRSRRVVYRFGLVVGRNELDFDGRSRRVVGHHGRAAVGFRRVH